MMEKAIGDEDGKKLFVEQGLRTMSSPGFQKKKKWSKLFDDVEEEEEEGKVRECV